MKLTPFVVSALGYVHGGGKTLVEFYRDHEPVGPILWRQLDERGLATRDADGRLSLTEAGSADLARASRGGGCPAGGARVDAGAGAARGGG